MSAVCRLSAVSVYGGISIDGIGDCAVAGYFNFNCCD